MSLVTHCPSCATAFKVVRDQLRISDGWVRCGRCGHVFDVGVMAHEASASDVAELAAPSRTETDVLTAARPPQDGGASAADSPPPIAAQWPTAQMLELLEAPELAPASPPESSPESSPISSVPPASAAAFTPTPADGPTRIAPPSPVEQALDAQVEQTLRSQRLAALRDSRVDARARTEALLGGEVPTDESEEGEFRAVPSSVPMPLTPSEPPTGPSFLEPPAKPSRPDSPSPALRLGCVLAFVALLAQMLMHERDVLAAHAPAFRPVLQMLCSIGGCKLAAPRDIDAVSIDGSSFSRGRGEGYHLVFTLRNAAAIPLAMPAVELTLLDLGERAIVRRVLPPEQFGAPAVLGPKGEYSAALTVELEAAQAAALAPVAGYHLMAFYP